MHIRHTKRAITWLTALGLVGLQMVSLGRGARSELGLPSARLATAQIQRLQVTDQMMLEDGGCTDTMFYCEGGGGGYTAPSTYYYGDYYDAGGYTNDSQTHSYMDQAYASDSRAYNEADWAWDDVNAMAAWPGVVVRGARYAYQAARSLTQTQRFRSYVGAAARFARDVAVGVVSAILAGWWNNISAYPDYWGPTYELEFMFDYSLR